MTTAPIQRYGHRPYTFAQGVQGIAITPAVVTQRLPKSSRKTTRRCRRQFFFPISLNTPSSSPPWPSIETSWTPYAGISSLSQGNMS